MDWRGTLRSRARDALRQSQAFGSRLKGRLGQPIPNAATLKAWWSGVVSGAVSSGTDLKDRLTRPGGRGTGVGTILKKRYLRRLPLRMAVAGQRFLNRWEQRPARFRQRVTVGVGLGLIAGMGVLLALWIMPRTVEPPEPRYSLIGLQALPGWHVDTVGDIRPALARSCAKLGALPADRPMAMQGHEALRAVTGLVADWQAACLRLETVPPDDPQAFRDYLLRTFQGYAVSSTDTESKGLFTGYYEAHINAARTRGGPYQVPVYGPPTDLVMDAGQGRRRVSGTLKPYYDRAAIEDGALDGTAPVLFWADDPVDLHILHIQGSGQVTLPDGSRTRIGYAANNGQSFVGIGRLVRERGLANGSSMPAIRAWLRENPEDGRALMRENPRYIFFREIAGDGPIGALGVPLTPLRSLAVDPTVLPLGSLVWLDTTDPDGMPLRRLMAAQDVGSAIKGINRGDVFWGSGEPAFQKAGRMASPGRTYLLVPRPMHGLDPLMM